MTSLTRSSVPWGAPPPPTVVKELVHSPDARFSSCILTEPATVSPSSLLVVRQGDRGLLHDVGVVAGEAKERKDLLSGPLQSLRCTKTDTV